MNIGSVNPVVSSNSAPSAPHSVAAAQNSFTSALKDALGTVNDSQQTANQMVTDLASGNSKQDLHNIMIAMQKADVLLKTTVQVRDRVISAYQEIMRMQI